MSDDTRPAGVTPATPREIPPGEEFGEWFDREFPDGDPTDPDDKEQAAGEQAAGEADASSAPSFASRAAGRIFRRPIAWWQRPWSTERIVRVLVTSATLVTTTVVMMMVVHFNPLSPARDLIFDDTTPTGGDMGAHVWAPAFLRDHFLPNFQLSGWTMDWYGGIPLYRFYMVIPALAIVALDVILPYGVAFKLVAVSGLLLFPLACWAFGRLAGFRHPIPELFSVAALCFLLDESFSIYGGNVKSTMAGEYSFSISLTLAMLGLGLLAHGLRTGRFRVWTAVVLSLAAVSHGIVLIFVAVSAIIMCLVWLDRRRLIFAVTTGITTLLLSAWWVGPFLFGHEFMTDMKYGFRPEGADDSFWDMFFPLAAPLDFIITALAVVGFVAMVLRRHLTGTAIGLICLTFVALVYLTRDSLPGIGLLWNPRLLPFVYLTRYLLMVIGALELITWLVNAARDRRALAELSASRRCRRRGGDHPVVSGGVRLDVRDASRWRTCHRGRVLGVRMGSVPEGSRIGAGGRRRVDPLQHARLRGPSEISRVQRARHHDGRHRSGARMWPCAVGEQRRQRRVRHDDGPDAASALDRRLHRVDGGAVLRGLGDHAVPLPHRRGDVEAVVEPRTPAALRQQRRGSRCAAHARSRRAVPDGAHPRGEGGGGSSGGPRVRHHERSVGDLRAARREHRRGAHRAAGRRRGSRRRPARAQPGGGYELVPASGGLAGDAGR
jgi:hypothetical protein